ncbi:uncharacterized protein [Onthophagus taurus]|uniref:uncharacterized protein n=1 Tax=Onthophagus taurus TaxID=166361 RepID=UPI0039BDF104
MKLEITDTAQNIIDQIVKSENIKNPSEISVSRGSQDGDGYVSKTYAISIKNDFGKDIKLFVKYLPDDMMLKWKTAFIEAFYTEYNFYAEIYPAFNEFENSKNIKEPFNNVPKHFNTKMRNGETPPIVLENLRSLGYTLRDRKKPIDDAHLILPIKAFAKYHAVNYAMKDQQSETYKKLTSGPRDILGNYFLEFGMYDMIEKCVKQLTDSFDPILDKEIMEHCTNLDQKLVNYMKNIFREYDEYFIIAQGDCWSNNMMFLYQEETGLPIDVKLIDWQCQRISSPLFDFSYFFYTLATKKELDNAEYYLKLYYDTLSQRIAELGSDPEKLFPYHIFRDHWRKYSKFGLCMAFSVIKIQLFEKDEIPNILNPDTEITPTEAFAVVLKSQDVYIKRLKDLLEYFIHHGLL